eukprot:scaffold658136_cov59-Prasinocladus_malaysianus.AAC.1
MTSSWLDAGSGGDRRTGGGAAGHLHPQAPAGRGQAGRLQAQLRAAGQPHRLRGPHLWARLLCPL